MPYEKLFETLAQYAPLSLEDQAILQKYFKPLHLNKKDVLLPYQSPCKQLFFVCEGLLKAYYTADTGKEIIRMVAWESRFLTNMDSFKTGQNSTEMIACIEKAVVLSISRADFEAMLKASPHLNAIYGKVMEDYNALHAKRFESMHVYSLAKKMAYLATEFPHLLQRLNDGQLAAFLNISREYYVKNKSFLYDFDEIVN
jgi:CRP-like cAMP-binding protein